MTRSRLSKTDPISLPNLSRSLNECFADPNRDEIRFWRLVQTYISRVANRHVPQQLLTEAVQDCMIEAFKSLPSLRIDPAHADANGGYEATWTGNSSLTRWLSGLTYRRCMHLLRAQARDRHLPVSQIAVPSDDGAMSELDLAELDDDPLTEREYLDGLGKEDQPQRISAALDAIRPLLKDRDRTIFDLLRSGRSQVDVARELGIPRATLNYRVRSWRRLARKHKIALQTL